MFTEAEAYRRQWWDHSQGWASPEHRQHYINLLRGDINECEGRLKTLYYELNLALQEPV